jgi:rhamnogalacturonyl hydrolase YesR
MNKLIALGFALLFAMTLNGCQKADQESEPQAIETTTESEAQPQAVASSAVVELANKAANWQLAHMDDFSYVRTFQGHTEFDRGWIQGAFYVGLTRWAKTTNNSIYWQVLQQKGEAAHWRLGDLVWHADDQVIAQTYAALAERNNDLALLQPSVTEFQIILKDRATNTLEFVAGGEAEGSCQRRWCWCDALFMAPPAWAAMSRLTGDPVYLDYALEEYQATVDYLYDQEEHLFYRDSRFFERRTKNGHKVFWSRGNGWVFAGLPLLLEELPDSDPRKANYQALFIEMAERLITVQQANGFWPSSLLDAEEFSIPESSGTGFMVFGLAWGINNGLLPADKFRAPVQAGWGALVSAVDDSGRLGWVQQVGYSPEQVQQDDTQLYGVGALLLAASEMLKLN